MEGDACWWGDLNGGFVIGENGDRGVVVFGLVEVIEVGEFGGGIDE